MGRLLGVLLRGSRVQDLHACRRACGIPGHTTRKDDLISELMRHAQSPREHEAIFAHLLNNMTTEAVRRWASMMRALGHVVPPAKVMGRSRAEVLHAIISSDQPGTKDDGGSSAAGSAEPGTHVGESGCQQPDLGSVLVAFDGAFDGPRRTRRRLHKRWSKLAQRASLPGRVRRGVC